MKFIVFILMSVCAFGMDVKLMSKEDQQQDIVYKINIHETLSNSYDEDALEKRALIKAKDYAINDQGTVFISSMSVQNSGQLYNEYKLAVGELQVSPVKLEARQIKIVNNEFNAQVVVYVDREEMTFIRNKIKKQLKNNMQVDINGIRADADRMVEEKRSDPYWYRKDYGGKPILMTLDRDGEPCEVLWAKEGTSQKLASYGGECSASTDHKWATEAYYRKEYLKSPDDPIFSWWHKYRTKEQLEKVMSEDKGLIAYRKAKGKTFRPNPYGIPPEDYDGKAPFELPKEF